MGGRRIRISELACQWGHFALILSGFKFKLEHVRVRIYEQIVARSRLHRLEREYERSHASLAL